MSLRSVGKIQTPRPAAVPRLCLQTAVTSRFSPRASGFTAVSRAERCSLGSSCARSSPRLCLGSSEGGSQLRISPRFGQSSQPELAEVRKKAAARTRQAKAEAAHISRRRESITGSASSPSIEQKAKRETKDKNSSVRITEHSLDLRHDSSKNPCAGARRPNPLLGGSLASQQDDNRHGPACYRSPSFSQLGESSIEESVQSTFEDVLRERASYMSLFGDEDLEDSDLDACSIGSYGDKVTELCQRAESLVRDLSSDLDASMMHSARASAVPQMPPLDDTDPSMWQGSGSCKDRNVLFAELGACATPLPTPPSTPPPARTREDRFLEVSSIKEMALEDVQPPVDKTPSFEKAQPGRPAPFPCFLEESNASAMALATPPTTPIASSADTAASTDDPSSWPDLQPWLRSMCPTAQAAAGASQRKEGGLQLSDLQFRVSRLELQLGQINSADEKPPMNDDVAELRRHVEIAQAELQATRLEAQETQEQLRWLLQYAGAGIAEAVAGPHQSGCGLDAIAPYAHVGRVLRRDSSSSQESQVPTIRHAASGQLSAGMRSPVQMPRARSLDSGSRKRFYPLASSKQLGSQQRLPGCGVTDKPACRQRSFPSPCPAPRVVDVPVRMCTSQQLVQVAKQRPLWLQKVADTTPARSSSRAGKGTSPHLCSRGLKSDWHA